MSKSIHGTTKMTNAERRSNYFMWRESGKPAILAWECAKIGPPFIGLDWGPDTFAWPPTTTVIIKPMVGLERMLQKSQEFEKMKALVEQAILNRISSSTILRELSPRE